MRGIRLGRVFGIEIRIDYSWFVIFFLILWTFTVVVFPAQFPGLGAGVYVAMGTIATVLFFASVLAHELSHSLVARAKGIEVEGITLFIFGGLAHAREEFDEPGDEFLIAGAGPLTSLAVAALFGGATWLGARLGWSVAVTGVALQLAILNAVLAVFNLLPGFPLDGGRLFRAAVWKWTGDPVKATRWATTGGRALGYLLMGFGLLQMFGGALVGGLWSVFIGWFIRTAAEASLTQYLLLRALHGVRAAELMTPDPETVPPGLTLRELVDRYALRSRNRAFPVVEDGRPVGIVSMRQLEAIPREQWTERSVRDTMVPVEKGIAVAPGERMPAVLERLEAEGTGGRLLVVRDGRLAGILTRTDVVRWIERMRLAEGPPRA